MSIRNKFIIIFSFLAMFVPGEVCGLQNDYGQFAFCFPEMMHRYISYGEKFPDLRPEQVVIEVNLCLDRKAYTGVARIEQPERAEVFVNKYNALPEEYIPADLVSVGKDYAKSGVRLRRDCFDAFMEMAADAAKDGAALYIRSGYRSYAAQGGGRKRVDSRWYAWPGHSEHQTGLAFDLCTKGVEHRYLGDYDYEKTKEYSYLMDHAHEYGFILSYPKGKERLTGFNFEPWHFRFVGKEIAAQINEKSICFAEYHAMIDAESR